MFERQRRQPKSPRPAFLSGSPASRVAPQAEPVLEDEKPKKRAAKKAAPKKDGPDE